jgi:hypothetical protein
MEWALVYPPTARGGGGLGFAPTKARSTGLELELPGQTWTPASVAVQLPAGPRWKVPVLEWTCAHLCTFGYTLSPLDGGKVAALAGVRYRTVVLEHSHHSLPLPHQLVLLGQTQGLEDYVLEDIATWDRSGLQVRHIMRLMHGKHHASWQKLTEKDVANCLGRSHIALDAENFVADLVDRRVRLGWHVKVHRPDNVLCGLPRADQAGQ